MDFMPEVMSVFLLSMGVQVYLCYQFTVFWLDLGVTINSQETGPNFMLQNTLFFGQ
jgi:hypothetical protein